MIILEGKIYPMQKLGDFMICWMLESNHCTNCRDGHSALSSATRLMGIKTYYNLAEDCVDAIAYFVKGILPEDNVAPGSYYEVHTTRFR